MYVCSRVLRRQVSERLASCLSRRNLSYGPTRAITSKVFEEFHQNRLQLPSTPAITGTFIHRFYCNKRPPASSSYDDDEDDDDPWTEDDWSSDDEPIRRTDLAVSNTVPEHFPKVPLIGIKYPIFPKFSKIVEVSDPKLIHRLEWCVANYVPYAGVFVLKDSDSETTAVTDINQVHPVGTFIKIGEMERRGNKLHLIATGHRRIKIVRALAMHEHKMVKEEGENKTKVGADEKPKDSGEKKPIDSSDPPKVISDVKNGANVSSETPKADAPKPKDNGVKPPWWKTPVKPKNTYVAVRSPHERYNPPKSNGLDTIQMVETENMTAGEVDKQSTEYKAITLEIVSTIRQIITENAFIQEAVKQMLGENLNVADNPAYLADLAAAITSAIPAELQQILNEEDVSSVHE